MTGIITGDISKSRKSATTVWIGGLKKILDAMGKSPKAWEIYRGDEFQLEIKEPGATLMAALQIKAYLKTMKLDARMGIGIGEKEYDAKKISESNGSAFVRSGELFETLKKQKISLAVNSGNIALDTELNLMLRLAMTFIDNWLPQSAEFFLVTIENPTLSQEEIGLKLGINQAAVSRRRKRAQFDLVMEFDRHFREKIKTLAV